MAAGATLTLAAQPVLPRQQVGRARAAAALLYTARASTAGCSLEINTPDITCHPPRYSGCSRCVTVLCWAERHLPAFALFSLCSCPLRAAGLFRPWQRALPGQRRRPGVCGLARVVGRGQPERQPRPHRPVLCFCSLPCGADQELWAAAAVARHAQRPALVRCVRVHCWALGSSGPWPQAAVAPGCCLPVPCSGPTPLPAWLSFCMQGSPACPPAGSARPARRSGNNAELHPEGGNKQGVVFAPGRYDPSRRVDLPRLQEFESSVILEGTPRVARWQTGCNSCLLARGATQAVKGRPAAELFWC